MTEIEVIIFLQERVELFVFSVCFHWVFSASWLYFWFLLMKAAVSGGDGLTDFLFFRLDAYSFLSRFWFLHRDTYFSFLVLLFQINLENCWFFMFPNHGTQIDNRIDLACCPVIFKNDHFLNTLRNLLKTQILFELYSTKSDLVLFALWIVCQEISLIDLHQELCIIQLR